ncbi:SpoIID/LytB domain-containing protein [Fredinandcohnia humi]
MRKFLFLSLSLLLFFSFPTHQHAETVTYPNQVNVSIYSSTSFSINLAGTYQLVNLQTGEKSILSTGSKTVTKSGSNVTLTDGATVYQSSTGFKMNEIQGGVKQVSFLADTPIYKGATTSYAIATVAPKGSIAAYNDTFTNGSGEIWYNVTLNGTTGWVQSVSSQLIDSPVVPLATVNNLKYRGSFELKPSGEKVQVINQLDMEDYLKGVVPSEMPSSWHIEALKAQAIAARSYAQNSMNLSNTTSSQVYRGFSGETARTNQAIEETKGLLVKYNGKPIQTFFYSTSGGRTSNVGDVWNSNQSSFPYLVSVEDKYEVSPYSSWSYTFSALSVLKQFGFNDSTILYDVLSVPSGANGEVRAVTVKTSNGDKTISGNESVIRKLFPTGESKYYNQILSNWFTIKVNKEQKDLSVQTAAGTEDLSAVKGQMVQTAAGVQTISEENVTVQTANGRISTVGGVDSIVLNGKGWGHRIGMSQYGAKGYAENGWTAEQILTHYFQGTTVSK